MFLDHYINYLLFEKRFSSHTVEAYQFEVRQFEEFLNKVNESVKSVDYHQLRTYFSTLLEQGRHPNSVNRSLSALKTYYHFLMREGVVHNDPIVGVKALRKPRKLPTTVSANSLSVMLDAEGVFGADFAGIRDRLVMELLFGTGIRLSELLSIRMEDVDLYKEQILIHGKRNKQRLVPLTSSLTKLLREYVALRESLPEGQSNVLVLTDRGKDAYAKLIYRIVQKYLALVSTQSQRSPHVLRHTFATAMLENGADLNAIKELLGHASLSATQVYTHNSAERLKKIYQQAHPRA